MAGKRTADWISDPIRDRLGAGAGVAALHLLLGYALLTGLALELPSQTEARLRVFEIVSPPPPPPTVPPPQRRSGEEGAAAPEGGAARPDLIAAPTPEIRVAAPLIPVSPLPTPAVPSAAEDAGRGVAAGAGSGAGGQGTGTGSGGSGTGSGGGGTDAVRIEGRLMDRDYPRAASPAEGWVYVRFTVDASGRARGCRIDRSSGSALLDATTCRLIERRFRYRPARDASGRATAQETGLSFYWGVRG